eukprot:8926586-Pyramimonas_sp.AAC.1
MAHGSGVREVMHMAKAYAEGQGGGSHAIRDRGKRRSVLTHVSPRLRRASHCQFCPRCGSSSSDPPISS